MQEGHDGAIGRRLRGFVLAVHVAGSAGVLAELLLMEHWEGWRQWIPLALLAASLFLLAWHGVTRGALPLRAFRLLMVSFVAAGAAGGWFHYAGNVEFARELDPSLSGWRLFAEAITGAFPALAPGAMAQLGLLGLVFTFRHPALAGRGNGASPGME